MIRRPFWRLAGVVLLLWSSAADAQTTAPAESSVTSPRFRDFVHAAILSPAPLVLAVGGGALDQVSNMPEEWSGASGFAKRNLARLGSGFASDAIGHSVAAAIHHRVKYDPCTCRGFARVTHAVGRAFVAVHDDGHRVPHVSLWIAKYSAAGLANTWYPASYGRDDIVREGALGILTSGGLNILKEFSAELMRLVPFR
jgi:hypothetical protein